VAFAVEIRKTVEKDLRNVPADDVQAIRDAIGALASTPRPDGCAKMSSEFEGKYRLRVGKYRVTYEVHDDKLAVIVVRAQNRREVSR